MAARSCRDRATILRPFRRIEPGHSNEPTVLSWRVDHAHQKRLSARPSEAITASIAPSSKVWRADGHAGAANSRDSNLSFVPASDSQIKSDANAGEISETLHNPRIDDRFRRSNRTPIRTLTQWIDVIKHFDMPISSWSSSRSATMRRGGLFMAASASQGKADGPQDRECPRERRRADVR